MEFNIAKPLTRQKSSILNLNPNFVLAASHVFLPEEWGLVGIMWEEMEAKTGLWPVMGLGTALGSLGETGCLQVVFYTKSLRQETRSILLP